MAKKYPWEEWFKKKQFEITRGEDYTILSYSMAQQIRNKATEYGVLVNVQVSATRIVVKVERRDWVIKYKRDMRQGVGT